VGRGLEGAWESKRDRVVLDQAHDRCDQPVVQVGQEAHMERIHVGVVGQ
jgi:hypothetical protein